MIYGLIGSFLILFAFIAWRSREQALIIVVATLPLYLVRFSLGPLPSTVLEGMIGILCVTWFILDKRFSLTLVTLWRRYRFLSLSLSLFLIAATISVFVSNDTRAALGIWRAYFIEPAGVFLVAVDVIRSKKQFVRIFCASLVSGASIATIAVYQRFTGWHIPPPWLLEMRVTSIYSYPNAVGLYLAPLIPLGIVRFFDTLKQAKKIKVAILIFFASALSLVAIYYAKTEGALVALAVALPVMGFLWSAKTRIVAGVVCVLVAGLVFSSPALESSVQEKLFLRDWSGQVRQKTWKETKAMLTDHTIFGAGLAGYSGAMVPYHKAKHLEIFLYPHTVALNFWSEVGLLGLFAFMVVVGAFFSLLFESVRAGGKNAAFVRLYSLGACGAMLTILIHGLVDVPYFKNDLAVFFWLLIFYAVCLHRNAYEQKNI